MKRRVELNAPLRRQRFLATAHIRHPIPQRVRFPGWLTIQTVTATNAPMRKSLSEKILSRAAGDGNKIFGRPENEEAEIMCMYCRCEEWLESFTTHVVNYKNCLIIIKNVPCVECEQCGEKYYRDEVAQQLDKIISVAKELAQEISVIDYRQAA